MTTTKPCAECGLEAAHSVTCPYLKRIEEVYKFAKAFVYGETAREREDNAIRLTVAVNKQVLASKGVFNVDHASL